MPLEQSDWIDDAVGSLDRAERSIRSFITERPLLTVSVAVGAGLLASIVAQRVARGAQAQGHGQAHGRNS